MGDSSSSWRLTATARDDDQHPLLAAVTTVRRQAMAPLAAVAVGLRLIGWISAEMVMLAGIGSLLWAFYLLLGSCLVAIGVAWRRSTPSEKERPFEPHSAQGRPSSTKDP